MPRSLVCRYSESGVVIANILLNVAAIRIVSNFVNLSTRVIASSLAVTLNCGLLAILQKYVSMSTSLSYTITGGAARHEKVKPKTWRISASADAIWFLRLQVFTTDQPRCYAFNKVLPPLAFTEKNCGFPVFGTNLQGKILFFRLLTQEPVKIVRKCFF